MTEDQLPEQTPEESAAEVEQPSQQGTTGEALSNEEIDLIVNRRMEAEQRKYQEMTASLEQQYKTKEFQLYARDRILAEGLPLEIIPHLKLTDNAALEDTIKVVNAVINTRYQSEMAKRLAGISPQSGGRIEPSKEDKLRSVWGLK